MPAPSSEPECRDALAAVRVVLVRPRGAANVGAAARAMRNCGVRELVLVRPALRSAAAAARMAVHAGDVLRAARRVATLADAVADCHLVVGTTARGGGYRRRAEDLEAAAPALAAAAAGGRVALVFGPEDHGLANDDLRHCQRLITIDTHPGYASLNLAQAVLLVCHALYRAAAASAPRSAAADAPAAAGELEGLYAHLQAALLGIGFLNPQNPDHAMFALRALIARATPSLPEVRLLRGLARQIAWAASARAGAAPPRRSSGDDASPLRTGHRSPVTGHRP